MRESQLLASLPEFDGVVGRACSCGHHHATIRLQKQKDHVLNVTELRWKPDKLLSCQTKFGTAYL